MLLNYSGWQREIIEQHQAGLGCSQFDMDEFINKALHLSSNRRRLESMGNNARLLAEKEFNRDLLSSKVLKVLENVVES